MPVSTASERRDAHRHALTLDQCAAASSPTTPTGELSGSFSDVDLLLEKLGKPAILELGKPLPERKFMPRERAGRCQATHNEALFRD